MNAATLNAAPLNAAPLNAATLSATAHGAVPPHPVLLGVVLAGGKSSRMGRDKAALPHPHGGMYLTHALEQLAQCCEHLACSIARDVRAESLLALPPEVHPLHDVRSDRGPAEGVALATDFAITLRCAGVFVTPVDLPNLHAQHLRLLRDAFTASSDSIVCAVSDDCESSKPLQPLVAIYPVRLKNQLCRLAGSTSRSLYRFIERQRYVCVPMPADVLHNVNSPHDYRSPSDPPS